MSQSTRIVALKQQKSQYFNLSNIIAGLIGAAMVGTDTAMNVEFAKGPDGEITGLMAAVPAVTIGLALVFPYLDRAWQRGQYIYVLLAFAFVLPAMAFSLSASLDRAASSRDATVTGKKTKNMAYALAEADLKEAKDRHAKHRAKEASEKAPICLTTKRPSRVCPNWYKARAKATAAAVDMKRARERMAKAGVPQVADSMASRIAKVTPAWVSVDLVQTVQPMLLPIALQLGGLFFLGLAFTSVSAKQDQKPVQAAPVKLSKKDQALAWYFNQIEQGIEIKVTQLAKKYNVHKSTASRWLKQAAA